MSDDVNARFTCTSCGRGIQMSGAEFFFGRGVPRCPCQEMIGCEDCPDVRFPPDMAGELAWLDHVQTEHPEVFANAESPPHPEG